MKVDASKNPPRSPSAKGGGIRIPMALLACLLFSPPLARGEPFSDLHLGGFVKSLDLYSQAPPRSGIPSGKISSNRLRLDLTGRMAQSLDWEVSLEDLLLYTDPEGFVPLPGDSPNRSVDLEKNWSEGKHFQNQLQIDRLNLAAAFAEIDWTVGRQAIGFGRILIFSPLDVIAPFSPDALDTDVRPGVDALRGVHYFGLGGQVGAVAVLGGRSRDNSYLGTFSYNVAGIDLLGLAGRLRQRAMGGIGLAGSLGGLGLKGELTCYEGKDVDEPGGDLHDTFAIGAVEGWYRFRNDLVLVAEYLYNGAGVDGPEDYPEAAVSAPFREGLSFLLGRHYLLLAPSRELHPLVTASALSIWNIEDDSFLLRPLVELSLSDNLELQLFWTFNRGKKPRRLPFPLPPVPRSEFGSIGDSGGIFLKYFF